MEIKLVYYSYWKPFLNCCDAVGLVSRRAFGLEKNSVMVVLVYLVVIAVVVIIVVTGVSVVMSFNNKQR